MNPIKTIMSWFTLCAKSFDNEPNENYIRMKDERNNKIHSGKLFLLTPDMVSGSVCVPKHQN